MPKRWKLYGIGARSPSQTVRSFTEDDIILPGVEVILSGLMTHLMMPWTLLLSGTKKHIEPMTPEQRSEKAGYRIERTRCCHGKVAEQRPDFLYRSQYEA
jgi:hypothetical protein